MQLLKLKPCVLLEHLVYTIFCLNISELKPKRKPRALTYWQKLDAMPHDVRHYYTHDPAYSQAGDRYMRDEITLAELKEIYARLIAGPASTIPGTTLIPASSSPSAPVQAQARSSSASAA